MFTLEKRESRNALYIPIGYRGDPTSLQLSRRKAYAGFFRELEDMRSLLL